MGNVLSASTIYANAYLTKKGREYLFNKNNGRFLTDPANGLMIDLLQITHFSLSDPDVNYNLTSGYNLETGDIPDISGNNENCIKSTAITNERNLISFDGELVTTNSTDQDIDIEYDTDQDSDTVDVNINVTSQPNALSQS
jgi:hypothetical protein